DLDPDVFAPYEKARKEREKIRPPAGPTIEEEHPGVFIYPKRGEPTGREPIAPTSIQQQFPKKIPYGEYTDPRRAAQAAWMQRQSESFQKLPPEDKMLLGVVAAPAIRALGLGGLTTSSRVAPGGWAGGPGWSGGGLGIAGRAIGGATAPFFAEHPLAG